MAMKSKDFFFEPNSTKFNIPLIKDMPFNGGLNPVNFYENKRKYFMKNNILNEIEQIKHEDSQNNLNFLKLIKITVTDLEKATNDAKSAIEKLTPSQVSELKCTKKLLHIERNIIEILNYLIGNFYFHWETFKEKINYFELKYKMENLEFDKYEPFMINKFLNKISSKDEFENNYLKDKFEIGYIIYSWIKPVIKIYMYKYQNNEINFEKHSHSEYKEKKVLTNSKNLTNSSVNHNNDQSQNSSKVIKNCIVSNSHSISNYNQFELIKPTMKSKFYSNLDTKQSINSPKFSKQIDSNKISIKDNFKSLNSIGFSDVSVPVNIKSKLLTKEKENFYLTQMTKKHSKIRFNSNKTNYEREIEAELKKYPNKEIKIDYNFSKDKNEKADKIQDIPLLYIRTFGQLRTHFNVNKSSGIKKKNYNSRHFQELNELSLRDSKIKDDLILKFIAKGKLKALESDVIENFIEDKKNFRI